MTWRLLIIVGAAAGLAGSSRVDAQGASPRRPEIKVEIPRTLRPPPGMCRVWVDQVPASQQPAPTDCATAIRNRPPNGRVIFADEQPARGKARDASKGETKGEAKPPKKPDDRPPRGRDTTSRG